MNEELQEIVDKRVLWAGYEITTNEQAKSIIRNNINQMCNHWVSTGFALKQARDKEFYKQDGYTSIQDYAYSEFGIKKQRAYKIVPLTSDPNQALTITLPINNENITLGLTIRYNSIANYWVMTISDGNGNLILDSLPLVPGDYPAADILGQYQYLGIGSAFIVNASNSDLDIPNNISLGVDHFLLWGDSV